MKWDEIAGQQPARDYLRFVHGESKVPHALIIAGAAGTGQLPLAVAFAAALQCESPNGDHPCGQCKVCHKSFKLIHPDIHFVFPVANMSKSKDSTRAFMSEFRDLFLQNPYISFEDWIQHIQAENKQANISAKECREILNTLLLKRFEGNKKIMIIWLPEFLGKEGNILLKLIEEPENDTVLILVTENKEAILPTILSRCQLVNTQLIQDEEIVDYLQKKYNCPIEKAQEAAWMAAGKLNEAIRFIEASEPTDAPEFLNWLRICFKGIPSEMVGWVDNFSKLSKDSQKHFFIYGLHFLNQCTRGHYLPLEQLRINAGDKEAMSGLLPMLTIDILNELVNNFNDDLMHLERNANVKIMMMATSIRVNRLLRSQVTQSV